MANDTGIVNIHGKDYQTVAYRVEKFRESWSEYEIITELIEATDDKVVMKASVADKSSRVLATGHAEEVRGSTNINKTSALENAETSAIGRALSAFGLAGSSYASADEVAGAIAQQEIDAASQRYQDLARAVYDHYHSIHAVKNHLANNELSAAIEAWYELTQEEQKTLWVAPSKGGPFTTEERATMKSEEWAEARKEQLA